MRVCWGLIFRVGGVVLEESWWFQGGFLEGSWCALWGLGRGIFGGFNPVWHGIGKQEKCLSLEEPRGNFFKLNELGRVSTFTAKRIGNI